MNIFTVTLATRGFAINVSVEADTEREARKLAVAEANAAELHNWDDCTGPGSVSSITFHRVKWTSRHVCEVYQN